MPSFRKAQDQAENVIRKKLQLGKARHTHKHDRKIHSLGTARNYQQSLTRLAQWLKDNRLEDLQRLSQKTALRYLETRGQSVGQKMLDQDRQAIQLLLGTQLPVIKSEFTQALKSRAYTLQQIELVAKRQTEKNQLATWIAAAAGLRAHELFTLRRKEERKASSHRTWSAHRFIGRQGKLYTVVGKGGLIREVLIPLALAVELESKRFASPITVYDRKIKYIQYYDIAGGKNWTNSFSAASKRILGWSHGAHGMRHTFAQQRMDELQQRGFSYPDALGLVSQAMGHFRSDITEVYLGK
jgi:integrase